MLGNNKHVSNVFSIPKRKILILGFIKFWLKADAHGYLFVLMLNIRVNKMGLS